MDPGQRRAVETAALVALLERELDDLEALRMRSQGSEQAGGVLAGRAFHDGRALRERVIEGQRILAIAEVHAANEPTRIQTPTRRSVSKGRRVSGSASGSTWRRSAMRLM